MAEVTLSTVVDLNLIKMKWREPFVSEGLNRKVIPSQPAGVYQGLRIIQNLGSPRQIELAADADTSFHVAVYQRTTGFSLTYWDVAGTSIILDLSSASLDSQETVIGLEIDYTVGADTTANWKAFPIADWNALPAARKNEIVVLGTVNVPAPATNITTAMITLDKVTMAWRNLSKGAVTWSPVVRNGNFERGESNSANVWFWDLAVTAGTGTGTLKIRETDPSRGLKALTLANLTNGTVTYVAKQSVGFPVTPGQLGMIRFKKKNLVVAAAGTMFVLLDFVDVTGQDDATVSASIDITGVDASYVDVVVHFAVPASQSMLKAVRISGTPNYAGSPADVLRIDDLNVWLETEGERSDLQHEASGDTEVNGRLSIRDPEGLFDASSVEISHESVANQLTVDDQAASGTLKVLLNGEMSVNRNLASVGSSLIGSITDPDIARLVAPASVFAGVEYTLMWESVPAGQAGHRIYVGSDGRTVRSFNASYTNSTNLWSQDITTVDAAATYEDAQGIFVKRKFKNASDWAETAWDLVRVVVDHNGYRTGRVSEIREEWIDAAAPPGWTSSSGGAASVTFTSDTAIFESPSVKMLTSAAAATNSLTTDDDIVFPSTDKIWVLETEVYFDNIADVSGQVGFLKATGSTSGAYFSYVPSVSAFWRAITFDDTNFATPNVIITADAPVANTPQRLRIEMYGSAIPGGARVVFYIDGVQVAESTTKQPDFRMPLLITSGDDGAGVGRTFVISPLLASYNRVLNDDVL